MYFDRIVPRTLGPLVMLPLGFPVRILLVTVPPILP